MVNYTDNELQKFMPLDFWKLFFPAEYLSDIVAFTNEKLCDHHSTVSEKELLKFFDI